MFSDLLEEYLAARGDGARRNSSPEAGHQAAHQRAEARFTRAKIALDDAFEAVKENATKAYELSHSHDSGYSTYEDMAGWGQP
jgi:hypothetical protein